MTRLDDKIAAGDIIVIDGGMGTELERRGVPMHTQTWAGAALVEYPDAAVDVHADYIRAGAEVIITNTFGASPHMLSAMGHGERAEAIIRGSVDLAKRARDQVGRDVAIAGSISTMAAGGDLTDPGNCHSDDEIADSLGRMARALADGGCDVIALEMMRDTVRSPVAMLCAKETGLPVWLGLACTREKDSGDLVAFDFPENRFADTVAAMVPLEPDLVSVMHSNVDVTDDAIDALAPHWNGPLGVYPEAGYFEMPHWHFVDVIAPDALVERARAWAGKGVTLFGGCCGLGPAHIAALDGARESLEASRRRDRREGHVPRSGSGALVC